MERNTWLQWGHRLSAVETGQPPGGHAGQRQASMGPPPFGGGNVLKNWTPLGSASWLQWGHRLSAVETDLLPLQPRLPWNGRLQWGHRLSAVETYPRTSPPMTMPSCFNGATAFRRWKPAVHQSGPPIADGASMGPPPFGGGNAKKGMWKFWRPKASMGPPPFGGGNDTGWTDGPTKITT